MTFCNCGKNGCILGRGSFGIIFRGKFKSENEDNKEVKDVAVKRVAKHSVEMIELKILRLVNDHPNILHYYDTCTDKNSDYM